MRGSWVGARDTCVFRKTGNAQLNLHLFPTLLHSLLPFPIFSTRLDILVTQCLLVRSMTCSIPLLLIGFVNVITETVQQDFIAVDALASFDPLFSLAVLVSLVTATISLHKSG